MIKPDKIPKFLNPSNVRFAGPVEGEPDLVVLRYENSTLFVPKAEFEARYPELDLGTFEPRIRVWSHGNSTHIVTPDWNVFELWALPWTCDPEKLASSSNYWTLYRFGKYLERYDFMDPTEDEIAESARDLRAFRRNQLKFLKENVL